MANKFSIHTFNSIFGNGLPDLKVFELNLAGASGLTDSSCKILTEAISKLTKIECLILNFSRSATLTNESGLYFVGLLQNLFNLECLSLNFNDCLKLDN